MRISRLGEHGGTPENPFAPQENPFGPPEQGPWKEILDPSTGTTDSSGSSGGDIGGFDVSGLPFQFNPPMHKLSRLILTDLGEGKRNQKSSLAQYYDETNNRYDADFAVRTGSSKTKFENLRLGRIIMDDIAVSAGVKESGVRSGFRFLYNPSSLGGMLNVSANFIPDQRATNTVVLQQGLENLTFEVLLNRIPDVNSKAKVSDYLPQIGTAALKRLQEQGTAYDVDYLYRCANGVHDTMSRKRTGDIGVLLPNPCRLILGPFTTRGAITNVSVSDQMFSGGMVPILSYVNITFSRFLSTAQSDIQKLESLGIARDGGSSSSSDSSGGVPPDGPKPPGQSLTGRSVYNLAKGAGFSSSEADIMTQIAAMESNWNTSAFNGNSNTGDESYGLWQINMLGDLGPDMRRKLGISSNNQLFDPVTNARAAMIRFKEHGQRFTPWSVYNDGSYKSVKIDWR